jgi:hypothetical protein
MAFLRFSKRFLTISSALRCPQKTLARGEFGKSSRGCGNRLARPFTRTPCSRYAILPGVAWVPCLSSRRRRSRRPLRRRDSAGVSQGTDRRRPRRQTVRRVARAPLRGDPRLLRDRPLGHARSAGDSRQRVHEARRVLDLSINHYEQFKRFSDQLASERCRERPAPRSIRAARAIRRAVAPASRGSRRRTIAERPCTARRRATRPAPSGPR